MGRREANEGAGVGGEKASPTSDGREKAQDRKLEDEKENFSEMRQREVKKFDVVVQKKTRTRRTEYEEEGEVTEENLITRGLKKSPMKVYSM